MGTTVEFGNLDSAFSSIFWLHCDFGALTHLILFMFRLQYLPPQLPRLLRPKKAAPALRVVPVVAKKPNQSKIQVPKLPNLPHSSNFCTILGLTQTQMDQVFVYKFTKGNKMNIKRQF